MTGKSVWGGKLNSAIKRYELKTAMTMKSYNDEITMPPKQLTSE